MVVTGVMLARAIPAVMAGPLAGVVLDRLDRKRIMIASDLIRAVVALGFILAIPRHDTWLLYLLSALLSMMGAGIASETWSPRTIGAVSGLLAVGELDRAASVACAGGRGAGGSGDSRRSCGINRA